MKIIGSILALCILQEAGAFVAQGPVAFKGTTTALKVSNDPTSPFYSGGSSTTTTSNPNNDRISARDIIRNKPSEQVRSTSSTYSGTSRDYIRDGNRNNNARKIMQTIPPVQVQGGSLKTWSYASPMIDRVQVVLRTEGRPLDADVELWQGPDNTPNRMRVYVEDGALRPFSAVIETPRGPNTISIRNVGQLEFPMLAHVVAEAQGNSPVGPLLDRAEVKSATTIQGGALRTFRFDPVVESVRVMLKTDGRPLTARIELLQGPNNIKQAIELYIEDGLDRPFYAIIDTPGSGNVVRVVNTATMEFPMMASIEAYEYGKAGTYSDVVIGGDNGGGWGRGDISSNWRGDGGFGGRGDSYGGRSESWGNSWGSSRF